MPFAASEKDESERHGRDDNELHDKKDFVHGAADSTLPHVRQTSRFPGSPSAYREYE